MDFPKWAMEDGEVLANLIYDKLVEKGTLSIDEVFEIYDNCGFSILRKTEGATWKILNQKVERIKDENNRIAFKLKEVKS